MANRVHRHVAVWLATEAGKALNAWCEKRAVKHFAAMGWSIRFSMVCGDQQYIHVWGGDSGYSDKEPVRMFLGYGKDMASLSVEVFEERNRCYGTAAEARIAERNKILADDVFLTKAAAAIDAYTQAKAVLELVMGECGPLNEAYYPIKHLAGIKD